MTSDLGATIEQWSQQLRAKQPPGELTKFIEHEFPEALEAASSKGAPLLPTSLLPGFGTSFLHRSKVFSLFFGWSTRLDFETWRCATAFGPGGLLRVSNRPQTLSRVLRDDSPALTPADAEPLAELLAEALRPEGPPDSYALGHPYRESRMRSSLLTSYRLKQIDTDPTGYLAPADPAAWKAVRPSVTAPSLELVPGGGVATFFYLDGTSSPAPGDQGALFRLLRFRCPMEAGTYAIHPQCDELGRLGFRMPAQPVPGRPLLVGGEPRQPPLVRLAR